MALQVALNQLRHSKDTTVNKKVEKERVRIVWLVI